MLGDVGFTDIVRFYYRIAPIGSRNLTSPQSLPIPWGVPSEHSMASMQYFNRTGSICSKQMIRLNDIECSVRSRTSGIDNFRGVTGGVYKARERIHRCMLISDY